MDALTIIWVIVCAYLLLNLLVGVYCHIRVKDSTDYLLAGRRIGILMTAGTLAATEIGGGSTVGVAAKAYGSWGFICRLVRSLCRDWGLFSLLSSHHCYDVPWQRPYRRSSVVALVDLAISLRRFFLCSQQLPWQAYRLLQQQPLLAFLLDFQQS